MRHKVQDLDKRLVLLAGAGCALILCLALYLYFGRSVNKEKRVNHAAPLVKVQQVVRQDMMRHIALSGQTVQDANIPLAPKYTGKLTQVYVKLGDFVKQGQVIRLCWS